jgi:hypothetical protein
MMSDKAQITAMLSNLGFGPIKSGIACWRRGSRKQAEPPLWIQINPNAKWPEATHPTRKIADATPSSTAS